MFIPDMDQVWHLAWNGRVLGRDGGVIRQLSEWSSRSLRQRQEQWQQSESEPEPEPEPEQRQRQQQEQEQEQSLEFRFTGTRVLLAGDSIDRPDPLRPAWRFWIQGARFAEAGAEGQHEVRILALDPDESRRLPAPLLLAWLLGIVLTEAASA